MDALLVDRYGMPNVFPSIFVTSSVAFLNDELGGAIAIEEECLECACFSRCVYTRLPLVAYGVVPVAI